MAKKEYKNNIWNILWFVQMCDIYVAMFSLFTWLCVEDSFSQCDFFIHI